MAGASSIVNFDGEGTEAGKGISSEVKLDNLGDRVQNPDTVKWNKQRTAAKSKLNRWEGIIQCILQYYNI